MRDADFILATNLARVRVALHCLGQLMPTNGGELEKQEDAIRVLYDLEQAWQAAAERRKPAKDERKAGKR